MDQQHNMHNGQGSFVFSLFCSIVGWADIPPILASTASVVAIASGVYSIYVTNKKSKK